MTTVFLSYRQKDTKSVTNRIYEILKNWYFEEDDYVFMDIHSVVPANEWEQELRNSLKETDVVLAIIGKQWGQGLSTQGDYPRQEVASALSMGIPVVPILVNGAALPTRGRLPHGLKSLLKRQALRLARTNLEKQLLPLWVTIEKITKNLQNDDEVWLRYLLACNPDRGRNVAAVRTLAEGQSDCKFLSHLSYRRLESLLESLCKQGWLSYTEDEDYYYYWYDP